jgi:hypothetical protein
MARPSIPDRPACSLSLYLLLSEMQVCFIIYVICALSFIFT